jgi:hypothetical protein
MSTQPHFGEPQPGEPQSGEPQSGESQPTDRERRLVSILSRARRQGKLVVTERWLFSLGSALAVGGIVLVIIGWVGTSRTILVAGQIPYVVSGGLLGLGLIFLGGFLYFGYWLALLVRQGREQAEQDRADLARVGDGLQETNQALRAITDILGARLAPEPAGEPRRRRPVSVVSPLSGGGRALRATVPVPPGRVVARSGSRAHLAHCPLVAGREGLRSLGSGEVVRPCRVCLPGPDAD